MCGHCHGRCLPRPKNCLGSTAMGPALDLLLPWLFPSWAEWAKISLPWLAQF